MPSVAASRITSTGKCFSSSQRSACGAIFSAANSRAMSRTATWSSLRAKCMSAPGYDARQFIVGIENSAPSLTPDGQREVTVLVLV